jgi:hypothetical protein
MKRIVFLMFLLVLNSCNKNQDKSRTKSKVHLNTQSQVSNHVLDLLQGNWGKSKVSNVDFTIENKEIRYFEDPEKYSISLNGDTLIILQEDEILTKYRIISISTQKLELKPEEGENILLTKIL